jgi:spermidine synthase
MNPTTRFVLVLACFGISGFAALLYETVWIRQFALVFGTSELAVATVLAAYFGGLSIGAAVAARWVSRVRRPVLTYGLLELGIAAAALAVPYALRASQSLFARLFHSPDVLPAVGGNASAAYYLISSAIILLIPTGLMGATLPLLAAHSVRTQEEIGPRIGALYCVNTFGAVGGTLAAAFWLLPALGLGWTTRVGVGLNVVVFALAAMLARGAPIVSTPPVDEPREARQRGPFTLILPLMFISGAVSFTYEVLWTRLLMQLLGGSVYAFATMLASFLTGIALGAAIASRFATSGRRSLIGFSWVQGGAALLSATAYLMIDRLPAWSDRFAAGGGFRFGAAVAMSVLVLLPSAVCIGATFPFAVRVLAGSARAAAPASARTYAWNTIGAITGAVAAGFFLLPAFQFSGTIRLAMGTHLALAAAAACLAGKDRRRAAIAGIAALIVAGVVPLREPWGILRASPVAESAEGVVAFYSVGRSATVVVFDDDFEYSMRTNGLPEATIMRAGARDRFLLPRWLAGIGVLARPQARSMLNIGLGGGVALECVPTVLREIDVIELEPEVVRANAVLAGRRARDPLSDVRVRVCINDARSALVISGKEYDVITSQPSHPWTSGAAHLYSREFFSLVRDRLAPGGVFVQWMGIPFVDDSLLRCLAATLLDVFPHVVICRPQPNGLLFVCSDRPLELWKTAATAIAADPAAFADFGVRCVEDVCAVWMVDEDGVRRIADGASIVTDDLNFLQMRSPRVRGGGAKSLRAVLGVLSESEPLRPADMDLDTGRLVRRLCSQGEYQRAIALADAAPDHSQRWAAIGWICMARKDRERAIRMFDQALDASPTSVEAACGWLRARGAGLADDPSALQKTRAWPPPLPKIAEGLVAEARNDWLAIRDLDEPLAVASPLDSCHADALRLRALWRLRIGDDRDVGDAARMLDGHGRTELDDRTLLLHAEAQQRLGNEAGALANLWELTRRAGIRDPSPARAAAGILERITRGRSGGHRRDQLRDRIDKAYSHDSPPAPDP